MYRIIFISFVLLVSSRAFSQKEVLINELHPDKISFSSIFETVRFIKLESNSDCLLSGITTLKVDENRIFAYDNRIGKVFIFNDNGQFITKIPVAGKGPGEIILAKDFTLNRELDQIEILDTGSSKMLIFDYNGNFIKSSNSVVLSDFERINPKTYIGYSCNYPMVIEGKVIEAELVAFDNNGSLVKEYEKVREVPKSIQMETFSNLTISADGDVYLVPIMESKLFKISPNLEIEKVCHFEFETKIPKNLFDSGVKVQTGVGASEKQKYPLFIRGINVTEDIVNLTFSFDSDTYRFFWNMRSGETITVNSKDFMNDMVLIPSNGFRAAFEDGLIDIVNAHKFLSDYSTAINSDKIRDYQYYQKIQQELVKFASATDENDNPILFFYSYK